MSIWERLGNVIKSYINDDGERVFRRSAPRGDPDLDAAYEELDDFLRGEDRQTKTGERARTVPEDIRRAFAELGLTPDAGAEECKEAYKKLLKIHHPDRHTKHAENLKKATEKSARVNAAYELLVEWFKLTDNSP